MPFSKPRECRVCKRVFLSPQHLISHFKAFHYNRHLSTFSSLAAAAPTTFRHYPNLNRNPNPAFHARTHLDYYRRGYFDHQGKFRKGLPPSAINYKFLLPKTAKMPKLMDLFSGDVIGTYPYAVTSLPAGAPESGGYCDEERWSQLEFHRLVIDAVTLRQ